MNPPDTSTNPRFAALIGLDDWRPVVSIEIHLGNHQDEAAQGLGRSA